MLTFRRSLERGQAEHGWLKSFHTFSFAEYYDARYMGFGPLRVINEDYIQGGQGFGMHPHRDIEIITYVVSGALEHKDSMGNGTVITPGEVQYMCAGTGVRHSEFNPSPDQQTHLLQIWIVPDGSGHTPSYDQKNFSEQLNSGKLTLVVSSDGRDGSIAIHQNASLYAARMPLGEMTLPLNPQRQYWLQLISGKLVVGKEYMKPGDSLALTQEETLTLVCKSPSEFLFFDLV